MIIAPASKSLRLLDLVFSAVVMEVASKTVRTALHAYEHGCKDVQGNAEVLDVLTF